LGIEGSKAVRSTQQNSISYTREASRSRLHPNHPYFVTAKFQDGFDYNDERNDSAAAVGSNRRDILAALDELKREN
jgi:hypothetical protein